MVSGAGALASTFNETSLPSGDFPNTAPGYLLPFGTTTVIGQVNVEVGDIADFFEFQGLTPGSDILVSGITTDFDFDGLFMAAYTSGGTFLSGESLEGGSAFLTGLAPGDGKLVIEVAPFPGAEGLPCESCYGDYQVSVSNIPEPSAMAGTGLAMAAGALAWRRKRAKERN